MKRTLEIVEREMQETEEHLEALRAEADAHPEQLERRRDALRSGLTPGLFKRFVSRAEGPRLVAMETAFEEAAEHVKDDFYRDQWSITLRFSNNTTKNYTAGFWRYESSPKGSELSIAPTEDSDYRVFTTEEELWKAFCLANGGKEDEALAALALAAFCTMKLHKSRDDPTVTIRDMWEKWWRSDSRALECESSDSSD